ncbi:hypothetical protein B0H11DRAFT_2298829 [Mycena galericulata]|nr:hypothetical protein B0H11DRAFT_2298829 [Mycena galericulata]
MLIDECGIQFESGNVEFDECVDSDEASVESSDDAPEALKANADTSPPSFPGDSALVTDPGPDAPVVARPASPASTSSLWPYTNHDMDANAAYIYSGYAFDAYVPHGRKQGKPRLKPPFPADVGLFGWPTTVAVATTPRRSAAAARRGLRALGATATRARICSASVGTSTTRALWRRRWATAARTRREALRRRARRVGQPAHIPGGCSVPVLPIKKCEDSLKDAQSGLGTGAVIVMDKSTDIIAAIARFSSVGVPFFIISLPQFYKHELCGQCTLCREGTTWIMNMMNRMVEGRGHRRKIDMLLELTKQVEGCMICALDAAALPI